MWLENKGSYWNSEKVSVGQSRGLDLISSVSGIYNGEVYSPGYNMDEDKDLEDIIVNLSLFNPKYLRTFFYGVSTSRLPLLMQYQILSKVLLMGFPKVVYIFTIIFTIFAPILSLIKITLMIFGRGSLENNYSEGHFIKVFAYSNSFVRVFFMLGVSFMGAGLLFVKSPLLKFLFSIAR